jgi:hypothetical protein
MNERIEELFSALAPLVKKVKGNVVHVNYSGCGDSGSADFERIETAKGKEVDEKLYSELTAKVTITSSTWDFDNKCWKKNDQPEDKSISFLAEEIAYEMLLENTVGWEINAGSGGSLTITIDSPQITLDHTGYEDEEDEDGNTVEVVDCENVFDYFPKFLATSMSRKQLKPKISKKSVKKPAKKATKKGKV